MKVSRLLLLTLVVCFPMSIPVRIGAAAEKTAAAMEIDVKPEEVKLYPCLAAQFLTDEEAEFVIAEMGYYSEECGNIEYLTDRICHENGSKRDLTEKEVRLISENEKIFFEQVTHDCFETQREFEDYIRKVQNRLKAFKEREQYYLRQISELSKQALRHSVFGPKITTTVFDAELKFNAEENKKIVPWVNQVKTRYREHQERQRHNKTTAIK